MWQSRSFGPSTYNINSETALVHPNSLQMEKGTVVAPSNKLGSFSQGDTPSERLDRSLIRTIISLAGFNTELNDHQRRSSKVYKDVRMFIILGTQ